MPDRQPMGIQLPPAPKHPCPVCDRPVSDLDLMAHLNAHKPCASCGTRTGDHSYSCYLNGGK